MGVTSRSAPGFSRQRSFGPHYLLTKIAAIASNTFVESVRQPVFAVIAGIAVVVILLSPYLTMFTISESVKFMLDMGLATILMAGLLLAAFTASSVLHEEVENKTVLTVVSKPVGRMEFVLGKYLGVMLGLVVAAYLMTVALIVTLSGGGFEAQYAEEHNPAIALSILGAVVVSVGYGMYSNFFNDRPFASRTIGAAVPLFTILGILWFFFDPREVATAMPGQGALGTGIDLRKAVGFWKGVEMQTVFAAVLVLFSVLVLSSLAIAVSTRLAAVINVVICAGVFLLGLLSDFLFKETASQALEPGQMLVGGVTLAAVAGVVIALGLLAYRYATRYVNLWYALVALGAAVIVLVWLPGLTQRWVAYAAGGVLAAMLVASLLFYFRESKRLRGMLRASAYVGVFTVTSFAGPLAMRAAETMDLTAPKVMAAKLFYRVVPNLQALWIADILTAGQSVPLIYVLKSGAYAGFFVAAFLFLAVMLFRERQLA